MTTVLTERSTIPCLNIFFQVHIVRPLPTSSNGRYPASIRRILPQWLLVRKAVSSREQTTENPFLLRFQRRHSQLFSDLGHNLLFRDIRAFDHNFFADHDRGSAGQFGLRPFSGLVFGLGLM